MNPSQAISAFYSGYVDFNSRTSRPGFWWTVLYLVAVYVVLGLLASVSTVFSGVLVTLWFLAHVLPSVALAVRRLHDIGRSGLWLLLGFVPFGGLVLLVFYILPSERHANDWGPRP